MYTLSVTDITEYGLELMEYFTTNIIIVYFHIELIKLEEGVTDGSCLTWLYFYEGYGC